MFESPRGRDGSGGEASSTFSVPRRPGGYETPVARVRDGGPAEATAAKGWGVNEAGTWWHEGSLPGSTAIVVRTSDSSMLSSMFKLLREMVGVVQAWRA